MAKIFVNFRQYSLKQAYFREIAKKLGFLWTLGGGAGGGGAAGGRVLLHPAEGGRGLRPRQL
jgi:hypothetical protein